MSFPYEWRSQDNSAMADLICTLKCLMNCCECNKSILLAFYISKFAYCNIKNGLNTIPICFSVKYADLLFFQFLCTFSVGYPQSGLKCIR